MLQWWQHVSGSAVGSASGTLEILLLVPPPLWEIDDGVKGRAEPVYISIVFQD